MHVFQVFSSVFVNSPWKWHCHVKKIEKYCTGTLLDGWIITWKLPPSHWKLCYTERCLDCLLSRRVLLSGIQARDHLMQGLIVIRKCWFIKLREQSEVVAYELVRLYPTQKMFSFLSVVAHFLTRVRFVWISWVRLSTGTNTAELILIIICVIIASGTTFIVPFTFTFLQLPPQLPKTCSCLASKLRRYNNSWSNRESVGSIPTAIKDFFCFSHFLTKTLTLQNQPGYFSDPWFQPIKDEIPGIDVIFTRPSLFHHHHHHQHQHQHLYFFTKSFHYINDLRRSGEKSNKNKTTTQMKEFVHIGNSRATNTCRSLGATRAHFCKSLFVWFMVAEHSFLVYSC